MVYPITAHCMKFQRDEDGGFVVEAATIQDPIGFATTLCDEDGDPAVGRASWSRRCARYRYYTGLLTMVSDDNHGTAWVDEDGPRPLLVRRSTTASASAIDGSLRVRARGAAARRAPSACYQTGVLTTHVQGGCRMGSDPSARSSTPTASATTCGGCSSATARVVPRTLSVNPSLTIMSLATRLAEYLAGGTHGYFSGAAA